MGFKGEPGIRPVEPYDGRVLESSTPALSYPMADDVADLPLDPMVDARGCVLGRGRYRPRLEQLGEGMLLNIYIGDE